MRIENRHRLIVLAIAVLIFFFNLGRTRLWDDDEPRNATCAAEMLARGDWVVPTFNDQLRTDKPVLLYWFMMTSYSVLGVSEFAARFWSAAFAVGTVLMVYELGRTLYHARLGLWAALAMASCLMFNVSGRAATPDSTLIFCTTATLLLFVLGVSRNRVDGSATLPELRQDPWHAPNPTLPDCVPNTWRWWAAIYAVTGLAVLAKGPVGVVLPVAAIGLFLLTIVVPRSDQNSLLTRNPADEIDERPWWRTFPVRFAQATWAMRPFLLAGIVLLVALPWYALVYLHTDGEWVTGFLSKHNVDRFTNTMEGHRGPVFYYIPAILAGFFPWSIFLPLALVRSVRRAWGNLPGTAADKLVLCWAGLWIGLFSLSATKLPSYVVPAYPALALITARLIDAWLSEPSSLARRWQYAAWCSLAGVGLIMTVGLSVAARKLWGEGFIGIVGLIPLVAGLVALALSRRRSPQAALAVFATSAVLLSLTLMDIATVRVSRHHNGPDVIAKAREIGGDDFRLATFRHSEPSVVFYAGKPVQACQRPAEVQQFFEDAVAGVVVTNSDAYEAIMESLPSDVIVLAQMPRFLRTGDRVLLWADRRS